MKKYQVGSHIEAYPFEDTKLNIFNKNTGKSFVLGEKESGVFKLMNGANTIEDIQSRCSYYSIDEIGELANAFEKIGLFDKEKKKFNPFKIKFRLFNPNKMFNENGWITKLLNYLICIGSPLLFLLSVFQMRLITSKPASYLTGVINSFSSIRFTDVIFITVLSLICLALHEFGHTITARRYGVNVPEIGIMLYFLIPCAYTNISGINLLSPKGKRLLVLFSGTLVNMGLIGICYFLIGISSSSKTGMYCLALILINLGTILMNTMVLLKFDGYYILETILDEPKFRENAINHTLGIIKALISKDHDMVKALHESISEGSHLLQHITYIFYFVFSSAYIPFIILNTVAPFFM